jgi:hypothetical protein
MKAQTAEDINQWLKKQISELQNPVWEEEKNYSSSSENELETTLEITPV